MLSFFAYCHLETIASRSPLVFLEKVIGASSFSSTVASLRGQPSREDSMTVVKVNQRWDVFRQHSGVAALGRGSRPTEPGSPISRGPECRKHN